jgi:capsular polysaccharide transport system permease protein
MQTRLPGPAAVEAMSDISDTVPTTVTGPVSFQRLRVLFALVVRETGTRFGRSSGGYIWAIAEPLGGIILLTVAFSLALRRPPLGTNFALFYATGVIPFMLYSNIARSVAGAVASNRGLLRYPVVTALDTVFAKLVLELLTMVVVAALLFTGVIFFFGLDVRLDPAAMAASVGLAAMLGLGIGTLNCVLFGFFPTWKNFWTVLTRPLFIASAMFYLFESLPVRVQAVLWYNPLVHIVGLMRSGFYGTYEADYASPLYVLGFGLVPFVIGAYLLRRHETALIEQ